MYTGVNNGSRRYTFWWAYLPTKQCNLDFIFEIHFFFQNIMIIK